jgi:hypothetical protein
MGGVYRVEPVGLSKQPWPRLPKKKTGIGAAVARFLGVGGSLSPALTACDAWDWLDL